MQAIVRLKFEPMNHPCLTEMTGGKGLGNAFCLVALGQGAERVLKES